MRSGWDYDKLRQLSAGEERQQHDLTSKIVLYLCRWAEYYSAHVNELGYSSSKENSNESVERQVQHKDSSPTVSTSCVVQYKTAVLCDKTM